VSDKSAIEWTDATWNPVRGCTKISPGCKHCYAETFAERFRGVAGHPYADGFDLRLVPEKLDEPFRWSQPRFVFVNSMSDLFHADVPARYIREVFEVMAAANWHVYQVLTKRAERLAEVAQTLPASLVNREQVWLGVSVENRKHGLPRLDALRSTPAAVRFLSIEPLLEELGELDLEGIDWVIVGGESGHHARPMQERWVLSLRDQCERSGVPFFFKQWGGVRKKAAGRLLQGRTHDAMPWVRERVAPGRGERSRQLDDWRAGAALRLRSGH
jgi:protein gp37